MYLTLRTYQHMGRQAEQQDRVLALNSGSVALCLVSDGVGGQRGGAMAAQAVADTARWLWAAGIPAAEKAGVFLETLAVESHEAIQVLGARQGMDPRSTLAAVLLHGRRVSWVTCGDSRIYCFQKRQFLWRSKDHSVVELLKDKGMVSEDAMGAHPDQGKLFQCLGGAAAPEADFGAFELAAGQWLLLCSDGFWEHLAQDEIASLHRMFACSRARQQHRLVRAILQRAGERCDNISLIVVMPPAISLLLPKFLLR